MKMKGRNTGSKGKQGKGRRREAGTKRSFPGLPSVVDVTVRMPDAQEVELRGVSTDMLADLKMLISQRAEFIHLTHYAFSHPTRGILPDSQQVASLKLGALDVVFPEYTRAKSLEHIRHLMSIAASTTALGPRTELREPQDTGRSGAELSRPLKAGQPNSSSLEIVADVKDFYAFFSLHGLHCPLKSVSVKDGAVDAEQWTLPLLVTLSNGKQVDVVAGKAGFRLDSPGSDSTHNLVDLLKSTDSDFAGQWSNFVDAIGKLYPQGNPPHGVLANAWLVPPCMADDPTRPVLLPAEDPSLGAPNLGCAWGRQAGQEPRNWASEFREGEVQLRAEDPKGKAASKAKQAETHRRLFLAHCAYVDTAIVEGVEAAAEGGDRKVAGLKLNVKPEAARVSPSRGCTDRRVTEENSVAAILRGLANHDAPSAACMLEEVVVRHRGRVVEARADPDAAAPHGAPSVEDEPAAADCGAAALKLNALRWLLHVGCDSGVADLSIGEGTLRSTLDESVEELGGGRVGPPPLRWELAVAWASFLKTPPTEGPGAPAAQSPSYRISPAGGMRDPSAPPQPRLPYQFKPTPSGLSGGSDEGEAALKAALGPHAWAALAKLGVGLHRYSPEQLAIKAAEWYSQVALRRVVWELRRLEVAPVDGITLADFLHSRGINCRHLGRVIQLSKEAVVTEADALYEAAAEAAAEQKQQQQQQLSRGASAHTSQMAAEAGQRPPPPRSPGTMAHVTYVCQVDVVARALKHLLRAVIARASKAASSEKNDTGEQGRHGGRSVAAAIAATLNAALGSAEAPLHSELWGWLRGYVLQRYQYSLPNGRDSFGDRQILLRACCQKVGIELATRSYDFSVATPLSARDVVALIPVVKSPAYSLQEPRQLLDTAKADMDGGRLDAAAASATRALVLLSELAGGHHKLAAGAYSLLAVVLYHTGDFLQAAYYQQKALIINERALGLDHPDTLKSYGDLAVFYYRLQHHELALRYELRCTFMLGLTCGTGHPNTAATYINIAMMQEGLGRSSTALRFLHAALELNTALLGSDHVQTAASYHAMAIALSLMEPPLYSLSVQHEHTCWITLDRQLGASDTRTQDAAAWLEYFDHKASEQAAASSRGADDAVSRRVSEKSIASKGHLPVRDLMEFLGEDATLGTTSLSTRPGGGGKRTNGSKSRLTPSSPSIASVPEDSDLSSDDGEHVTFSVPPLSELARAAAVPTPAAVGNKECAIQGVPSPVSVLSETDAVAVDTTEDEEEVEGEDSSGAWMQVAPSRSNRNVESRQQRGPREQYRRYPRRSVKQAEPQRQHAARDQVHTPTVVDRPSTSSKESEPLPEPRSEEASSAVVEDSNQQTVEQPVEDSKPVKKTLDPGASEFVPTGRTVLPPPMMAMPHGIPLPPGHVIHPGLHHPGMPLSMPPPVGFVPPGMPMPEGAAPWPMMTAAMGPAPPPLSMAPGSVPPPHMHWMPWMYGSSPPPMMPPMPHPMMPPPPGMQAPPPVPFSPPPPPPPPPRSSAGVVATPVNPNFPASPEKPNAGRQLLAMLNSSENANKEAQAVTVQGEEQQQVAA